MDAFNTDRIYYWDIGIFPCICQKSCDTFHNEIADVGFIDVPCINENCIVMSL